MFIRLQNHYFNLDHIAEFSLNSTVIIVSPKNRACPVHINYRTKAEAEAAYDDLGKQIIEHNRVKSK